MQKTLFCHYYNEQFLLDAWLEHHTKLFDEIIMIDYQSTDQSSDIIEYWYKHTPKAYIRYNPSNNSDFGALNVDLEIEMYEKDINGWKMCLNVTEFLHGDFSVLSEQPCQHVVPSFMVVDDQFQTNVSGSLNLDKANGGIPHWVWNERAGRSFHNFNNIYPKPGRHYFVEPSQYSKDFVIFHYGWYPMCEETLNRKLQIQTRIPETDKNNHLGWHHITNREALLDKWKNEYLTKMENHAEYLDYWRERTKKCV
jgi:hypothetical protein